MVQQTNNKPFKLATRAGIFWFEGALLCLVRKENEWTPPILKVNTPNLRQKRVSMVIHVDTYEAGIKWQWADGPQRAPAWKARLFHPLYSCAHFVYQHYVHPVTDIFLNVQHTKIPFQMDALFLVALMKLGCFLHPC